MTTELEKQAPGALAPAPDFMPKSHRGFEDTVQSDLQIARLGLAQSNSPQVTDGDPARLEGLVVGGLFNSVTGQIYGKEVFIQVLRKMPLRAMEFRPIVEGGGVVDPNVPLGDVRLKWGTSGDKKKDRPVATLFRDFIARVLPTKENPAGEIIALSFKSSGINAAKTLWGLATMSNRDCFAGKFRIHTAPKLKPQPHQVYKVEQVGWVTEPEFKFGEEMYEAVQVITSEKIHHDAAPDPDDFDPNEIERQGQHPPSDM